MAPTTAYYPPGPEDRPPEPRRPEPERFDPRPPPGGGSLWWDYARSLIGPFEEPTSLWPWFDYETPDPYLDPYYYPNSSGYYQGSFVGDGSGRQIGRYDDRDTLGDSGDPDLFGAAGAVAAPSAPAPEERWTSAVVKPPEEPERPKEGLPRVKPTKRRKVGEKSLWWRYTQMLIDGINPLTGQPFGFDINKGPDGRRYSFPTPTDDGHEDGGSEVETEEKLDQRRVYATSTGPREEEPPAKKSRKVKRRPRARIQNKNVRFEEEMIDDCPPREWTDAEARLLVPPEAIARAQEEIQTGLTTTRNYLQERAEEVGRPVIALDQLRDTHKKLVVLRDRLLDAVLAESSAAVSSPWAQARDPSAPIDVRRGGGRPWSPPRSESEEALHEVGQRLAVVERAEDSLAHTMEQERRDVHSRLLGEIELLDSSYLQWEIGQISSDQRLAEVAGKLCLLKLRLEFAGQLGSSAEVADAAMAVWENELRERNAHWLDRPSALLERAAEAAVRRKARQFGLEYDRDAPGRLASSLAAKVGELREPWAGGISGTPTHDELVLYKRVLDDETDTLIDQYEDVVSVRDDIELARRQSEIAFEIAEMTAIDAATMALPIGPLVGKLARGVGRGSAFAGRKALGAGRTLGRAFSRVDELLNEAIRRAGERSLAQMGAAGTRAPVGGWTSKFPGVQLRQFGSAWVKRVDPSASRLMQLWGRSSIKAQASGLVQLHKAGRPAAGFRYSEAAGRIITEDVGPVLSRREYFGPSYWKARLKDTTALGTPLTDLAPRNYGIGYRAFDPALDPVHKFVLGVGVPGAVAAGAYTGYSIRER